MMKDIFEERAAREMCEPEVERAEPPRQYFGELWREGELAVCFGDVGVGKSVLAVQLADAAAGGREVKPGDLGRVLGYGCSWDGEGASEEAFWDEQQVLYVDLETASREFLCRYSDAGETAVVRWPFFPEGLTRIAADPSVIVPQDRTPVDGIILRGIEEKLKKTGAKVLVVDGLERFNGSIMRVSDIARVMKGLRRLKHELGLSILVTAPLPAGASARPLAPRLVATRTVLSLADSAFAVGQCRWDERLRYIRQLKSRSSEIVYDSEYTPAYRLSKQQGMYLSFRFEGFRREPVMLDAYLDKTRLERSDRIKRLYREQHKTIEQIARILSISLSSVHRSLNSWSPFDEERKEEGEKTPDGNATINERASESNSEISNFKSEIKNPSGNATVNERACPEVSSVLEVAKISKTAENPSKNDTSEISNFKSEIKNPTGNATVNERASESNPEISNFKSEIKNPTGNATVNERACPEVSSVLEVANISKTAENPSKNDTSEISNEPSDSASSRPCLKDKDIVTDDAHPMHGLKRLTVNGREIFVAREFPHNGRPEIYYTNNGRLRLHRSDGLSTLTKNVDRVSHSYTPPQTDPG